MFKNADNIINLQIEIKEEDIQQIHQHSKTEQEDQNNEEIQKSPKSTNSSKKLQEKASLKS